MSKPKKKTTKTATGKRRSHLALEPISVRVDENGNVHLPHRAAPSTGTYKGKKVVDVEKRVKRFVRNRTKTQS